MTDFPSQPTGDSDDARVETLDHVVERVRAWQESAPEGTIETELQTGLDEAGLELSDDQMQQVADAISEGRDVDSAAVLGARP